MAASPLIAAWAGLRPSHFELAREQSPVPGRPETGPPETAPATVALVALDQSPAVDPGIQGLAEKSDRRQLVRQ